jgi:tetratricopeptide (TPR) repeat protein
LRTVARRLAAIAVALATLGGARGALAQGEAAPTAFELGTSVQQSLARLQEEWLRWVGASLQESDGRADEALRSLTVTVREVGFQYLPDLALAAVAQARAAIRERDWPRAERQLAAAQAFDPSQPEIAFARARLAWAKGEPATAAAAQARGLWATLAQSGGRARASVALWALAVLAAAAAWFVVLLAWRHGRAAFVALRARLAPPLPDWAAVGVLTFFIVAPLALPGGVFWILWLASIALWSFAGRSQRVVLALGWLVAAGAPVVAERIERALAIDQTPPLRAWRAFESGRLYGGFFADAHVLRAALPEHPAALEFAADVHRTLGQWEVARSLYRKVLLAEPQNVPVLLNLGAYSFRKGDHTLANAYFLRATQTGTPSAAAWFNLSLGYSDSYLFDESREALGNARAIDGRAVDDWMATPNPDRVLSFNGSLGRRDEVRGALVEAWQQPQGGRPPWLTTGVLGAGLALLAVALALGFHAVRETPAGARREAAARGAGSGIAFWAEALLPALDATRRGRGLAAWANLLLLAALLLLPRAFEMAGDLPASSWPGPSVLGAVAALGLAIYLGVRIRVGLEERNV